jgi:hypothetical protein
VSDVKVFFLASSISFRFCKIIHHTILIPFFFSLYLVLFCDAPERDLAPVSTLENSTFEGCEKFLRNAAHKQTVYAKHLDKFLYFK